MSEISEPRRQGVPIKPIVTERPQIRSDVVKDVSAGQGLWTLST